ncbi:MAG: hypothetical protein SFV18_21650 [Bryobacteraceae bacterium]|nr:hypothetical protein [Bryobacteraceae bacterium]
MRRFAAIAMALASCARREPLPPVAAAAETLNSLDLLREEFNRSVEHPRVVLLLSPT